MTPVVTSIVSPAVARRTIAAVLRSGPLSPSQAEPLRRLALDPRTALRLLVGLGTDTITADTAQAVAAELVGIGLGVTAPDLLSAWGTAYAVTDRVGYTQSQGRLSVKALRRHGSEQVRELRDLALSLSPPRLALLHLLGAEAEDLPSASALRVLPEEIDRAA